MFKKMILSAALAASVIVLSLRYMQVQLLLLEYQPKTLVDLHQGRETGMG